MPIRKGTILMPTGGTDHLHVVMCDPTFDPISGFEVVLVANFSSVKADSYYDQACVVEPGVHSFIIRQSYIVYSKAALLRSDSVSANIANGSVRRHDPVSDELFNAILDGFTCSRHVARKLQRFIRQQGIV